MTKNPGHSYTIYIYLVGEGTDVWRPVEAEYLGDDCFRITSENLTMEDENWQFPSGSIVRCREQNLSAGSVLVAFQCVVRAT